MGFLRRSAFAALHQPVDVMPAIAADNKWHVEILPGNHDSFVIPETPAGQTPLDIFMRNFCAPQPVITPEARSLHRTAMTQPGVYFTLDAPFVRMIGLFSNALEDPGLISAEGETWPGVPGLQLDYLAAQLKRIRDEKYAGAVLLAVHHPPFSYAPTKGAGGAGGNHSSSSAMLREIDTICKQQGIYPHAVISGAQALCRHAERSHSGLQAFCRVPESGPLTALPLRISAASSCTWPRRG